MGLKNSIRRAHSSFASSIPCFQKSYFLSPPHHFFISQYSLLNLHYSYYYHLKPPTVLNQLLISHLRRSEAPLFVHHILSFLTLLLKKQQNKEVCEANPRSFRKRAAKQHNSKSWVGQSPTVLLTFFPFLYSYF